MAIRSQAESVGLPLDANLLQPKEVNGLDKYFATDSELSPVQTIASNALATAQNAVDRLEGDQDFFEGTGVFTGTPSNFLPSITTVNSQGISWTGTYFNFSYLGKYLVTITQNGDCVNSRTDWYQEVTIRLREGIGMKFEPFTFKSIPPSGTWNMETTSCNIIQVESGNQWRPVINMTANGSTSNGSFRIRIKKMV